MKYSLIATWNMSLNGISIAANLLDNGSTLKDAIIAGINDVENNPNFHSVGYGGLPDINCECSFDAGYMDGDNLKFGAVGSLRNIKNAINIAELLSHEDKNNFLVGQGALDYALEHGYQACDMLTQEAYEIYKNELENRKTIIPYHDTVCFIGMKDGHMVTGVSTSGLFMKHKDRIGDSPICGAGYYCDSKYGACAATGMGEDVARSLLSYRCVSLLKDGLDVISAVNKTLNEVKVRLNDVREISLIAMDANGHIAAATNNDFAYTVASETIKPHAVQLRTKNTINIID